MSRINRAVIKAALAGGGVLFVWGVVYVLVFADLLAGGFLASLVMARIIR